MSPSRSIVSLVAAATFTCPSLSLAQGGGERQFGPWVWGVEAAAEHQFDTNLSGAGGDFNVNRVSIQPSVGYAWNRQTMVALSLGISDSDYDFSAPANIGGLRPWGRLREYQLSMPIRFSPSRRSRAIVIPTIRSYGEEDASLDEGRSEGVLAAVGWQVSDALTIGPGAAWFSEPGGGSQAFPIIMLDWAITDRWRLSTGPGQAGTRGPGLSLNYSLNTKWQVALTGSYEKHRFALDDDGASRGGVGEDKSMPLRLSVQFSPWPMTSISAFVGSQFEGELSLEDAQGRTIGRSGYDTAGSMGFAFSSRF